MTEFVPLRLTRAEAMRRLKLSQHRWPLLQALADIGLVEIVPEPPATSVPDDMKDVLQRLKEAGLKVVPDD